MSALAFALLFDPQLNIYALVPRSEEALEPLVCRPNLKYHISFPFLPRYSSSELNRSLSWDHISKVTLAENCLGNFIYTGFQATIKTFQVIVPLRGY